MPRPTLLLLLPLLLLVSSCAAAAAPLETATFAAGCYWSVELVFQRTPGVVATAVGFAGGRAARPRYSDVVRGDTGHAEAVRLTYDPAVVPYTRLLGIFFDMHDSTQVNRQGNDVGTQYRSLIFAHSRTQHRAARAALDARRPRPATKLLLAEKHPFWDAHEEHQQYLEKGGQSAAKGALAPVRCYGNRRGPVKKPKAWWFAPVAAEEAEEAEL
jgi:peptide-methionine (S)-S-oxide reductase